MIKESNDPVVSLWINPTASTGRICWQLATVDGALSSPWTLSEIQLLPPIPSPIESILQFNLNSNCDGGADQCPAVQIEYSTNQGRQWRLLSSINSRHQGRLIRMALPTDALTSSTRFRWLGSANCSWALDDIHLSTCSMACSGHGTCLTTHQCLCDQGFKGQSCQEPINPLPTSLRHQFEADDDHENPIQLADYGGPCGIVAAGRAAVITPNSPFITKDLDTLSADANSIIQFAYKKCNSRSTLYVHSSCNGGIAWSLQASITTLSTESRQLRKNLTIEALGSSCRFKFSTTDGAIWAIDDLFIGPLDGGIVALDRTAFVGRHEPRDYCNRSDVMVLQSDELEETLPVKIESFSVVQLELTVDCHSSAAATSNKNHVVVVQFSTDGGQRWTNLDASRRQISELSTGIWRRIGIELPSESWSDSTRFRVAQLVNDSSERRVVAVDHFYAGKGVDCPQICRLNGRCTADGCQCDAGGFHGPECLPTPSTSTTPSIAFIAGGKLVTIDRDGCLIRGANNFQFDKAGIRILETEEIAVGVDGVVFHFLLRLGACNNVDDASVQVDVQLSWNGGLNWSPFREYRTPFYSNPGQLETIFIRSPPSGGGRDFVKIRFVQLGIHEENRNVWSLSGVGRRVEEEDDHIWLVSNVAEPIGKASCLVFDAHCPSRMRWYGAVTKQLNLDVNQVIEFKLLPADHDDDQYHHQVAFEYSIDGGSDWLLVQMDQQSSRMDYQSFNSTFHYDVTESMANG